MSNCTPPEYCGQITQHEAHGNCPGGNKCPIGYDHSAYYMDVMGHDSCAVCGWRGEGDEYWHG